jgi:hypothetical protein
MGKLSRFIKVIRDAKPPGSGSKHGEPKPPPEPPIPSFSDSKPDLSNEMMAEICQKYPEMVELIYTWPRLPESVRSAILTLVDNVKPV